MSDGVSTISQSFKVEWLNTTLKFVKNDNQMIMEFPEMPLSHVEYLHNLIWQRKNDVGLGFKSLYAPLWEAIRIFSLKYRFKVSVMKSKDNTGQLVIEKIKKTDQEAYRAPSNNEELVTDMKNVSQPKPEKQINKMKQTKSQKYYKDKSKIIESISPTFLRTTLQKILDFIKDKKEASLIFTDLAPIEAKFLENFLGIYNRRNVFETMMSPACNYIFNEMRKCFIHFDKTCKLEVDASKTNVKTKKREVTFLKVPRYVRPTTTRTMLTQTVNKTDIENSSTADKTDVNPRCKFLKALSVNAGLSNVINAPPAKIHIPSNSRIVNNNLEIKVQNESIKNTFTTDTQNMLNNSYVDKKTTGVGLDGNKCTNISDTKKVSSKISTKTDNKEKIINNQIKDNNIDTSENNVVCDETYKSELEDNQRKTSKSTTDKIKLKSEFRTDNQEKTTTESNTVTYYILQSEEKYIVDNNKSNKENCKSEINTENKSVIIYKSKFKQEKNCSETNDESNKSKISLDKGRSNTINNLAMENKKSKSDEKHSHNISEVNKDTKVESVNKDALKFLKDPSKKKISSKKSIIFEKSTESETNGAVGEQEVKSEIEKKGRERKKDSNSRKDKLLEAMSTPMESDKGLRMMQLMGWQGGALGLRGEGITEPIIPMLHLAPGAGLGHVTAKSIRKQAKLDFRIDILETILDLIDNDMTDTGINYKSEISKKDKRFLKTTLMSFNNRKHVSLPSGHESDLGKNILDKMMKECNLFIDVTVSSNNKEITLKKIITNNSDKNKLKSTKKNNIKVLTTNTVEDNNLYSNRIKLPVKKNDFKLLILSKVAELLKSEDKFIEIVFDSVLLSRHRDYVEKLSHNINRKEQYCGKRAKVFSEEINEKLGDSHLKMGYGANNMSLIIRKMFYENRFTNSATKNLNTISVNSEENNDKVMDVKTDATLTKNKKDNETLVTKDNLNINDELDKENRIEVVNNVNCDNKKVVEKVILITENILNIESGDNEHNSQQLDLINRNKTDIISVHINNNELIHCDKMKTDNIYNKEIKIDTVECNDANNNKNDVVTVRKLLQIKSDLNTRKESTERLSTVENMDKIDSIVTETKPSKEVLSNEFDIKCDKKHCDSNPEGDVSDEINASEVYSSSDKSAISKDTPTVFVNTDNRPQRIVIIEKVSELSSKLFLKVIQILIASKLSENFIPQLKCHGVEKRGIIYSCHNEESFQWLKEVLSNYKIIDYKQATDNKFTVQIKIKTMLEVKKVLILLELCNEGLCCGNWIVSEAKYGDFSVFLVDIDGDSLNYVCDNNFKLSIGVDEAQFSIYCSL